MLKIGDTVRCIKDTGHTLVGELYVVDNEKTTLSGTQFIIVIGSHHMFYAKDFELVSSSGPSYAINLVSQGYSAIFAMNPFYIKALPNLNNLTEQQHTMKCECGVDKVGGGKHSSWCPKHLSLN